MVNIPNKIEHSKKFVSCSGERFRKQFHGEVCEDGHIELVEDEPIDMWRHIQAEGVGASLPEIVARATAGDPTAFKQGESFYGDLVGMPTTYAEILNTVNDGKARFESLPVEVREKFDFSFEKWFATLGQTSWFDAMGFNKQAVSSAPDPSINPVDNKEVKE